MYKDGIVVKIETPEWIGEVEPSCGGNLYRLYSKKFDLEVLRTPPSHLAFKEKPEYYGTPVLLPPNRIALGAYSWNNSHYQLPLNDLTQTHHIHGVVLRESWQVESFSENAVTVRFDHDRTRLMFPGFPFPFTLKIQYNLEKDCVVQTTTCINNGTEDMPFGLGFHTAFALIAPDMRMTLSHTGQYWELDPIQKMPTWRLLPVDGQTANCLNGKQDVDAQPLSLQCPATSMIFAGKPFHGAALESQSRKVQVIYQTDPQYGQWCVWNRNSKEGFICIEPMTCMANALNSPLSHFENGLRTLKPGEFFHAYTKIYVNSIEL